MKRTGQLSEQWQSSQQKPGFSPPEQGRLFDIDKPEEAINPKESKQPDAGTAKSVESSSNEKTESRERIVPDLIKIRKELQKVIGEGCSLCQMPLGDCPRCIRKEQQLKNTLKLGRDEIRRWINVFNIGSRWNNM